MHDCKELGKETSRVGAYSEWDVLCFQFSPRQPRFTNVGNPKAEPTLK